MKKYPIKNIVALASEFSHWDWLMVESLYHVSLLLVSVALVSMTANFFGLQHNFGERMSYSFAFLSLFYFYKTISWGKRYVERVQLENASGSMTASASAFRPFARFRRDEWVDTIGDDGGDDDGSEK